MMDADTRRVPESMAYQVAELRQYLAYWRVEADELTSDLQSLPPQLAKMRKKQAAVLRRRATMEENRINLLIDYINEQRESRGKTRAEHPQPVNTLNSRSDLAS